MNHASGETACIRITVLLLLASAALGTDVTWTGAVSSDWNNAVNWNPSQVPTASDHVTINSGVVAVLGDATFAVMDWSGGTISGALTVASNGVLNLHGGGCTVLDLADSLTNAGTLTFGGGVALRLNGSSQVGQVVNLPGAVIDVRQDDDSPCWYLFPGGGLIDNRGLFRKSAGTGTASLASPLRNSGTVDAQSGTIAFLGGGDLDGTYNTAAGTAIKLVGGNFTQVSTPVFLGGGQSTMLGGSLTLTTDMILGLQLAGGTLYLGPDFQGGSITNLTLEGVTLASASTVIGTMSWSGGTISGALTVASNGVLNLHGGGCTVLDLAASLTNAGTLTFGGGVALRLNGSSQVGQVVNLPGAVIDVRQDDDSPCWYLFPGGGLIDNRGLFRKSAGTGTASLASPLRNSGTVDAQSGTIAFLGGGDLDGTYNTAAGTAIKLVGGNFTQVSTPVFLGGGQSTMLGGSLTLTTDMILGLQLAGGTLYLGPDFQGGSITNLTLEGVTLASASTVIGTMSWSGGTISGALTVASNGVLNLHGGGCTVLDLAASLTNAGTLTFGGGVALRLNGSSQVGQVVNLPGAVIDVRQDDDSPCWYLFPGGGLIDNRGLFRKSAG